VRGLEAVAEREGELRGAEGDVDVRAPAVLPALGGALREGADALLEAEEGLVDLGALDAALLVVVLAVGGALRAREVDEGERAVHAVAALADGDLADRVGARRDLVHLRGVGCAGRVSAADDLEQRLLRVAGELLQADDDDAPLVVLADLEALPVVEDVKGAAAVDLVEGGVDGEPLAAELLGGQRAENVAGDEGLDAAHRVRLPAARLAVGEARAPPPVLEGVADEGHDGGVVDVLGRLPLGKGVVEVEGGVLEVLGDAVHLHLGRVHNHARVQARHGIVVPRRGLPLVERALADDDADGVLARLGVALTLVAVLVAEGADHAQELERLLVQLHAGGRGGGGGGGQGGGREGAAAGPLRDRGEGGVGGDRRRGEEGGIHDVLALRLAVLRAPAPRLPVALDLLNRLHDWPLRLRQAALGGRRVVAALPGDGRAGRKRLHDGRWLRRDEA
jgi:hypothetical protein